MQPYTPHLEDVERQPGDADVEGSDIIVSDDDDFDYVSKHQRDPAAKNKQRAKNRTRNKLAKKSRRKNRG